MKNSDSRKNIHDGIRISSGNDGSFLPGKTLLNSQLLRLDFVSSTTLGMIRQKKQRYFFKSRYSSTSQYEYFQPDINYWNLQYGVFSSN